MKTKSVKLAEIYDVMKEMLDKGGTVNFNPRGTSMLPTLHNDGDRVVLKKLKEVKKYDLPLYIRDDGQFVLHRVHNVNDDGTFDMCGDNQWVIEKNVRKDQIVGTVVKIYRGKRSFSVNNIFYRVYVVVWVSIRPLRHIVFGGLRRIRCRINKM